jgi:uncharacterized lipoprotein
MNARIPGSLLLFLLLSGCALSPQVVDIRPALTAADVTAGRGATLSLEVKDARTSSVIGHRGGIYSRTATISTAEDVAASMRRQLAAVLENAGYRVAADGAAPVMHVELTRLDYSVKQKGLAREITTVAGIRAMFRKGDRSYNNTYTITRNSSMLMEPSAADNTKLINETLTAAFRRLLGDKELFGLVNGE